MIQEHEIVLYQVEDTNICVNVVFKDETFWMTQKAMAELFDVNVPAISNIYLIYLRKENFLKRQLFPKWK